MRVAPFLAAAGLAACVLQPPKSLSIYFVDVEGGPATLALLRSLHGVDSWQLHRSENPGAQNTADDRIANLDETTAHWLKLEAHEDGSFAITNGRTGATTTYGPR